MVWQKHAAERVARVQRLQRQRQKRKMTTRKTPNTRGQRSPRQRHRQEAIVIRIRTFEFHWDQCKCVAEYTGASMAKKHQKTKSKCWMIGVKELAPAERVERIGRLPEADLEAPNGNAQDAQHTQHA